MKVFKKILPYLITALIGAAAAVLVICLRSVWALPVRDRMGALSDAFLIPGAVLAGVGLLIFASNGGLFDMLAFGVLMIFNAFRRDLSKRRYKDFYEYREAKKGKNRDMAFMLIVGLFYIAVSVVFLIIYSNL